jgi:hypothetical protein
VIHDDTQFLRRVQQARDIAPIDHDAILRPDCVPYRGRPSIDKDAPRLDPRFDLPA